MAESSLSGITLTLKTSDDKEIVLPKEVWLVDAFRGVQRKIGIISVHMLTFSHTADRLHVDHFGQLAFGYESVLVPRASPEYLIPCICACESSSCAPLTKC